MDFFDNNLLIMLAVFLGAYFLYQRMAYKKSKVLKHVEQEYNDVLTSDKYKV